jgi:hypothetical protein
MSLSGNPSLQLLEYTRIIKLFQKCFPKESKVSNRISHVKKIECNTAQSLLWSYH